MGNDAAVRLPLQTRFATDPTGTRWRVSVRWMPWGLRFRGGDEALGVFDLGSFAGFSDGCAVLFVILVVLAMIPVAFFIVELGVFLIVFAVVVLLGGLTGLRQWAIEVESVPSGTVRWIVSRQRGVGAADAALTAVAEAIEHGAWTPPRHTPEP